MLDWTDLQNQTAPGTGSLADADDINKIAHEVINNGTAIVTLNAQMAQKQDVLTFDRRPTAGSTRPVESDGIFWQGIYSAANVDTDARTTSDLTVVLCDYTASDAMIAGGSIVAVYNPSYVYEYDGTFSTLPLARLTLSYAASPTTGSESSAFSYEVFFASGSTPTEIVIDETREGMTVIWVGADCETVNGVSRFIPQSNKGYDVVISRFSEGMFMAIVVELPVNFKE